jgi:hypothetical protein
MRPLLSKWKREKGTWPEGAGEAIYTLLAGYGTIIS